MLTKLRIKNFKCLGDTGPLDIRPLTFLVGPNSSGKSSVLQMLRVLRQTERRSDMNGPLATTGPDIEVGAYPDFVYRHDIGRDVEVETEWTQVAPIRGALQFSASFFYDSASTQIKLRQAVVRSPRAVERTLWEGTSNQYVWEIEISRSGRTERKAFPNVRPRMFARPHSDNPQSESEIDHFFTSGYPHPVPASGGVGWHLYRMVHIGHLRGVPKRAYVMSGGTPLDVGSSGEYVVDMLWAAGNSSEGDQRAFFSHVCAWLEKLGRVCELRLEPLGEANLLQVVAADSASGVKVSLTDVGFGAWQVLPVIAQCLNPFHDRTILVEQPEIHLHPKAQAELGDMFIETVTSRGRAVIVETHSEQILARVCRRVAERAPGGITRKDVAIYYFDPKEDGTHIQEVTLNDDGQYESFPPGFFEEGFEEAFAHMEAMSKHAR